MKKSLVILFALAACLLFTVCAAEDAGSTEPVAGMPNPVVEYDSLEAINEKVGVELMRPAVMGVTNESFTVINDTIAQYTCEINGIEWTFRAAHITDEDISGMYSEYNEFEPGQDFTLYVNEFYMDRFFDGEKQYTIVAEGPITDDGEELISEDVFMDLCMEFALIQEYHVDDPLVGDYDDAVGERATACVERFGDTYNISVTWSDSDLECTCWTMYDAVNEDGKLTYRGEEIGCYTYDEDGNETSSEVTMSNNVGYFEIKDGNLYWTGAAQEECRACEFVKTVYED